MNKVKLGSILIEQKESIKSPDGKGKDLIGVSNSIGLHVSRAKRIDDLSRYKLIEMGWFAYNPMRINVGSIGYVYKQDQIGIVSPDYVVFSCSDELLPEYLLYLLKSDEGIEAINRNASGAVRKRLYFNDLARIEIVLPSIESQRKRLIAFRRIKDLGNQISDHKSTGSLVSQLKQSILHEAIQGKITTEWRKQNPDVEPASELLKRIKAAKAQLIKDKKIRKEKPLPPITEDEIPFELPVGWVWCRLIDIGQPIIGLTYKPTDTSNSGTPVLRANNVVDGKIYMEDLVHVTFKVPANKMASAGDILICVRSGSKRLIGKSALIDQDGLSFGAFMSLIKSSINPYLYHFLQSDCFKNQIDDEKSTGINQLTQGILKSIIIPVPPEKEQEVIIQHLQELSNKCSDLEKEITQSEKHSQMLMQAVLKEAFESKKEEAHA